MHVSQLVQVYKEGELETELSDWFQDPREEQNLSSQNMSL